MRLTGECPARSPTRRSPASGRPRPGPRPLGRPVRCARRATRDQPLGLEVAEQLLGPGGHHRERLAALGRVDHRGQLARGTSVGPTARPGRVPRSIVGVRAASVDSGAIRTQGAVSIAASWACTTATSGSHPRGTVINRCRLSAGRSRVMTASSASRSAAAVARRQGRAVAPRTEHPARWSRGRTTAGPGTRTVASPRAVVTSALSDGA